jgi:hypothetical protein
LKYDQEPTRYRVVVLTSSSHSVGTASLPEIAEPQQGDRLKCDQEPARYRVVVLTSSGHSVDTASLPEIAVPLV